MKTPVVFMIFKRPDTTQKVFEIIRQVQPSKLLVVADGPRSSRPEEFEQCADTRDIINQVDWDCEVLKNYSDINMGCKKRFSTGLEWCFSLVEDAIILEDDCLPHITFFQYCEELLNKYRYDERVMMIAGSNYLGRWKSDSQSYHFSFGNSVWGWASWKRAWNYYDSTMRLWFDSEIKEVIRDLLSDDVVYHYRSRGFNLASSDRVDDWAYAWDFAKLLQSGFTVFPSVNLVSNIAVTRSSRDEEEIKNESEINSAISNLPTHFMYFPLKHPSYFVADKEYDRKRILKACGIPRKKYLLKFALAYFKLLMRLARSKSEYRNHDRALKKG